jgi:hypothetical protein
VELGYTNLRFVIGRICKYVYAKGTNKIYYTGTFTPLVVERIGIEIRLYRKGTYILADIHGMGQFCTKLAPPPYNKPRSCVSKIHTPMGMVWFGNV